MKILDKYLIREFFRKFLVSLVFFTILLLIVRFSETEISRFISWRMTVSQATALWRQNGDDDGWYVAGDRGRRV